MAEANKTVTIYPPAGAKLENGQDAVPVNISATKLPDALAGGWSPFPNTPAYGGKGEQDGAVSRFFSNIGSEVGDVASGLYQAATAPPETNIGKPMGRYAGSLIEAPKRLLIDPTIAKGHAAADAFHRGSYTEAALGGLATLDPFAPDVTRLYRQSASGDVAGALGRGVTDIGILTAPQLASRLGPKIGIGGKALANPIYDSIREKIGDVPIEPDKVNAAIAKMRDEVGEAYPENRYLKTMVKEMKKGRNVTVGGDPTQLQGPGPVVSSGMTYTRALMWRSRLSDMIDSAEKTPNLRRHLIRVRSAINESLRDTADEQGLGMQARQADFLWRRSEQLKGASSHAGFVGGGIAGYELGETLHAPGAGAFIGAMLGRRLGAHAGPKIADWLAYHPADQIPRSAGGAALGVSRSKPTTEEGEDTAPMMLPPLPD